MLYLRLIKLRTLFYGISVFFAATVFIVDYSYAAVGYEFHAVVEECESCSVIPIGSNLLVKLELKDLVTTAVDVDISTEDIESVSWRYANQALSDRYAAASATGRIENGELVAFEFSGLDWLEPRPPVYSNACGCFVGISATPTFFSFIDNEWSFGQIAPRSSDVTGIPPRGLGYSVDFGWVEASGQNFVVTPVPLGPAFLMFLPGLAALTRLKPRTRKSTSC